MLRLDPSAAFAAIRSEKQETLTKHRNHRYELLLLDVVDVVDVVVVVCMKLTIFYLYFVRLLYA